MKSGREKPAFNIQNDLLKHRKFVQYSSINFIKTVAKCSSLWYNEYIEREVKTLKKSKKKLEKRVVFYYAALIVIWVTVIALIALRN